MRQIKERDKVKRLLKPYPRHPAQITATRSITPRGIGTTVPAASRRKSRPASTASRAGAISPFGTSRGAVRKASNPSAAISAHNATSAGCPGALITASAVSPALASRSPGSRQRPCAAWAATDRNTPASP